MGRRPIQLPDDIYNKIFDKKIKIENDIFQNIGIKIDVPLTNVIGKMADQPLMLDDNELLDLGKRKWKNLKK